CIVSGGRTAWVNFYNAIFLIIFLLAAGNLIRMIPIAALAAVLMHIGYKLAGPQKWAGMAKLGTAQVAIFATTIVVTLCSDLLVGIFSGMVVKSLILAYYTLQSKAKTQRTDIGMFSMFRSPVEKSVTTDGVIDLHLKGVVNCFNSLKLRSAVDAVPENVNNVRVHFDNVSIADHSTLLYLYTTRDDWKRAGRTMDLIGLDQLKACASDKSSLRYRLSAAA
ncbi:MAG: SulP family inorganic anion transporter, partial [Terriglobales bacterium]